jgi:hypothetical protein
VSASQDLARGRWADFRRLWARESVSLLALPLTAVVTVHARAVAWLPGKRRAGGAPVTV